MDGNRRNRIDRTGSAEVCGRGVRSGPLSV